MNLWIIVSSLLFMSILEVRPVLLNTSHWLHFASKQLRGTLGELKRPARYPHYTVRHGGSGPYTWSLVSSDQWTSGFFPGLLWQMYNWTGDPWWKKTAHEWTMPLRNESKHHDLGMKMYYSFGLGYELTGEVEYLQALREASGHLAEKFRPSVGAINAWGRNLVIIDTLLNIQLFAFTYRVVPAAERENFKRFFNIAVSHADKTLRELIKPDGSTYHMFEYQPSSGNILRRDTTPQGYGLSRNKTSVWARGQAWAIYAYPALYRLTGMSRYISAAERVSDWYILHVPQGLVPYWDFGVPPQLEKYDTSTASCAAAGLLELSKYVPEPKATRYRKHAIATLHALTKRFIADPNASHAILTEAVSVFPASHSIIYGDYFFVEALLRLQALEGHPNSGSKSPPVVLEPLKEFEGHAEKVLELPAMPNLPAADGHITDQSSMAAATLGPDPESSTFLSPDRVFIMLFSIACLCLFLRVGSRI